MSEEGEESGPAASTAALHRAGRHVEHAGGLGDGIALHVHQDESGPLVMRQRAEGLQQLAVQIVALRRRRGGFVRFQELLQALRVVDR
jgi:hypothetical protein